MIILVELIKLNESDRWDAIVKSFSRYDVYYLSSYVKAFENHGDGEAVLIYYTNKTTKAINVVMKRDIADHPCFESKIEKNKYFDIATPYGYGGFLIEGEEYDTLEEEYINFAVSQGIVSEFVRFHTMLDNYHMVSDMYDGIYLGNTVFLDTSDENVIWANINSKNRNMIRKAQKSGLNVYWSRDKSIIPEFMRIYNATMDKDSADKYYYFDEDFYLSVLNDLKYNAMWFYSVIDDEIAAIAIFMFANGQMHYHLSASERKYQHLAPTNLLLYEAAVWASRNGYKTLHLGGGVGCKQDSLYKFKKAFNRGEDKNFYIGKKIFDNDTYQKLVELRQDDIKNPSFFPQYRG